MAAPKGLGRGFESLIPTQLLDDTFDPTHTQDEKVSHYKEVQLDLLKPDPDQPRRQFDEAYMEELAASIRLHGILQPLVVTKKGSGYMIVAGERRYRAALMAGIATAPVIVRTLGDQNRLELALIENVQRRDLNPLETATGYLKLHQQFNMSYEQIGDRIGGKAVSTISNILRLLQLPQPAKEALVNGVITEGHARQILAMPDQKEQLLLLKFILQQEWSVRRTEQYVVAFKQGKANRDKKVLRGNNTETPQTKNLGSKLKAHVRLKPMAKGGQLMIRYNSDEELDRITKQLLI